MIAPQTIVGIDVGTSKICTAIGQCTRQGEVTLLGVGRAVSRGLRKGVVADLDRTILSIRESKSMAEQAAGVDIDTAFVAVGGAHISAFPTSATVAVSDTQKGITEADTERALDLARRVEVPKGRRLIDIIVKEYIVDGRVGIADPVGMSGMKLEVNALAITGSVPHLEGVLRAVNHAGIDVEDLILAPIASAEAVLTSEQKERGVALIDLGGGTTDVVAYEHGALSHLAMIPVGGDHVDSDLAYGIGITARQAEHIKIHLGGVGPEHQTSNDIIEITKGGNHKGTIPLKIITDIILPRLEEIFLLSREELEKAVTLKQLAAGAVLVGGSAMLPGTADLASRVLGLPVSIGRPREVNGLTSETEGPAYAAAVGLVKLGAMQYRENEEAMTGSPLMHALLTVAEWGKSFARALFR